jgi:hypothetical protein
VGATWNGLTIGQSTLANVRTQLGVYGVRNSATDPTTFRNPDPGRQQQWTEVEACFIGPNRILIALNICRPNIVAPFDLPETLEEWLKQYGKPEKVTWTPSYDGRSLIWPETGILAVVDVPLEATNCVILFPPLSAEELATSLLLASLPSELQGGPTEDVAFRSDQEDPWGIER